MANSFDKHLKGGVNTHAEEKDGIKTYTFKDSQGNEYVLKVASDQDIDLDKILQIVFDKDDRKEEDAERLDQDVDDEDLNDDEEDEEEDVWNNDFVNTFVAVLNHLHFDEAFEIRSTPVSIRLVDRMHRNNMYTITLVNTCSNAYDGVIVRAIHRKNGTLEEIPVNFYDAVGVNILFCPCGPFGRLTAINDDGEEICDSDDEMNVADGAALFAVSILGELTLAYSNILPEANPEDQNEKQGEEPENE